jgi:hypothetical protein
MNTAPADYQKLNPSVMDRTRELNLPPSNSLLLNPSIFYAYVKEAKMDLFVIMSIKSILA